MVSMWASLVERLLMVFDARSCSRMDSTLAAMFLTLAVSASNGPAVSIFSVDFLEGMVLERENTAQIQEAQGWYGAAELIT